MSISLDFMRVPRIFVRGGPNKFDNVFFLVEDGIDNPNTIISGPSSSLGWRVDDGPTLYAGLVAW